MIKIGDEVQTPDGVGRVAQTHNGCALVNICGGQAHDVFCLDQLTKLRDTPYTTGLGRIVAKIVSRTRAWKAFQESVELELAMYSYTGIYAIDDGSIVEKIQREVCLAVADRLRLDSELVFECLQNYLHAPRGFSS